MNFPNEPERQDNYDTYVDKWVPNMEWRGLARLVREESETAPLLQTWCAEAKLVFEEEVKACALLENVLGGPVTRLVQTYLVGEPPSQDHVDRAHDFVVEYIYQEHFVSARTEKQVLQFSGIDTQPIQPGDLIYRTFTIRIVLNDAGDKLVSQFTIEFTGRVRVAN